MQDISTEFLKWKSLDRWENEGGMPSLDEADPDTKKGSNFRGKAGGARRSAATEERENNIRRHSYDH
jgi:hypothetical protein